MTRSIIVWLAGSEMEVQPGQFFLKESYEKCFFGVF